MSDFDQEALTSSWSATTAHPTVASIFVADVAAKMSGSASASSSSTCERASYSSVVRGWHDARCASFIMLDVAAPDAKQDVAAPDAKQDVAAPDAKQDAAVVEAERVKLPFAEAGKLVGCRHYGDWVVNSKKLKTPAVINEDPPEVSVLASSGCILL